MKLSHITKLNLRPKPLWRGPIEDGITSSLLRKFLSCRERFRVHVIDGLRPTDNFESKLEFGNMWHVCEEHHSRRQPWEGPLRAYCMGLMRRYPFSQDQVTHWHDICCALFPRYIQHWSSHPDNIHRTPLFQEKIFSVSYRLPSGRSVLLRGKWDAGDVLDHHEEAGQWYAAGVWLGENKTKSSISPSRIAQQLGFDLQTMFYMVALTHADLEVIGLSESTLPAGGMLGVRYNVVRRAAHKSVASMLKKVDEDARNGRSGEWFARWKIAISTRDVDRFRRQSLDPVLENLLDWWDSQTEQRLQPVPDGYRTPTSWRTPYFYNPLAEGGVSEVDRYLDTGDKTGLRKFDNLYPELSPAA